MNNVLKVVVSLTCLWFVFLSAVAVSTPSVVGAWQARAELAFYKEADRINLWVE